jgi:type VI secretion system protein ImpK
MPTLREVFTPLIAYMLFLMGAPAELGRPVEEIRHEVSRLLDQQQAAVKRYDIAPQDYENACFAIIAWLDEGLIRAAHDANPDLFASWRHAPLQVELFSTANAGEEFFERLARLTPAQKQVIELYHLALCLGFRGRYYDESQEVQLIELRRQYAAHLPVPLLEPLDFEKRQEYVTPQPYLVQAPQRKPPRPGSSPYWLAAPALAVAALLLYFLWPASLNPQEVRNAVRGFDCARIEVAAIDKGVVMLTGRVASDVERDDVLRKVASIHGVKAVSDDFTIIPRPFCEVMEILAPFHDSQSRHATTLDIRPTKGCDSTYYRGENLEVDISAEKPLHYLYVDYYVADREMVAHMLPNPQESSNSIDASSTLRIGAPGNKAQWQIQPPFGREMLAVISSPKPLFSPPRLDPETANDYLISSRKALKTEAADPAVVAAYCFITTLDR